MDRELVRELQINIGKVSEHFSDWTAFNLTMDGGKSGFWRTRPHVCFAGGLGFLVIALNRVE